jgi:hypothetical protein
VSILEKIAIELLTSNQKRAAMPEGEKPNNRGLEGYGRSQR